MSLSELEPPKSPYDFMNSKRAKRLLSEEIHQEKQVIEQRWQKYGSPLGKYYRLIEEFILEPMDPEYDSWEGLLLEDIIDFHKKLKAELEVAGYTPPYEKYADPADVDFVSIVRSYFRYNRSYPEATLYEYDGNWKVRYSRGSIVSTMYWEAYIETLNKLSEVEFKQFLNEIEESISKNKIVKVDGVFVTGPVRLDLFYDL